MGRQISLRTHKKSINQERNNGKLASIKINNVCSTKINTESEEANHRGIEELALCTFDWRLEMRMQTECLPASKRRKRRHKTTEREGGAGVGAGHRAHIEALQERTFKWKGIHLYLLTTSRD